MPVKRFQKHTCNKSRLSDSLNSQRWRFLERGLDDFREGFLPPCSSIGIQRPTKGPVPLILPSQPNCLGQRQQRPKIMLSKPQSSTPKLRPMFHARKSHIAQTEYCLSQHPLALYPHFEESIPPELFKEVLSILDPEMLPMSEEAEADIEQERLVLSTIPSWLEDKRNRHTRVNKGPKGKDPYKWFSKTEVAAREREARLNYVPPLDENVKRATKELCSWLDSLGGDKYNTDEATIISLFDTGYETKPPLSVPIYAVELNNVPAELRNYVGMPPPQATMKSTSWQGSCAKDSCQAKWEKMRYGAWYLDPKTWTKQKVNKPLEDPKSKDARIMNLRRALGEKDAEILQLHGTHAFKEFLERKGYQIPEFLRQMLAAQTTTGPSVGALRKARSEFQREEMLEEDGSSATKD